MKRASLVATSLLAGAVAGAFIMLAVQGASSAPVAAPTTTAAPPPITSAPAPTSAEPTIPEEVPESDQVLLVWTPSGLPPGLAGEVAALEGVAAATVVQGDVVHLLASTGADGKALEGPPPGFVIPVEMMAFDQQTYFAFLPKEESFVFNELLPGQVILGSTSADLRGLAPGGSLSLEGGAVLEVAAVVPDLLVGGAEAAVAVGDANAAGVTVERYLLVRYSGPRAEIESSVRDLLPEGLAVRIRAPGETPVLRHGDAVLPQVLIKEAFGEFAYRPGQGRSFAIDPAWVEANILTAEVPLLGEATCHRNLIPLLSGAMEDLDARNLEFLVDPQGFRGCYNPRFIGAGRGISRHAWGAAVDINLGSNPQGLESAQDPRLVEVMQRWGFTSGHEWLIPDPGHFEYVQPPVTG